MKTVEIVILQNLVYNEEYSRKVTPFLREEYFHDRIEKLIFNLIRDYILKYKNLPSKEALNIALEKNTILNENEYKDAITTIESLISNDANPDWLIKETENFCKDKAVYNAIMESIHIIDGKSQDKTDTSIPHILSDALAVSFDAHIGHDYIEDADERYKFYHQKEKRIPFDLEFLNDITSGGTPSKTLNIVMAGTGVGKSAFLCHHAANCLIQSLNVLYITCEMAEERIAERIDANLMDITMDELKELPEMVYAKKISKIQNKNNGKLIVKEYPTATASTSHFRHLLDELNIKKNFKPDIIFVDYLNICASSRMKMGSSINSYTYIKAIAEELRGLAVERNVPIWSATQVNRTGFTSSDFGLEDTSESFGLPATADFMLALIGTEELDELNQIMVKQLKNRYNDAVSNRKFVIGINRAKMKLFDLEDNAQIGLVNTGQKDNFGVGFNGNNFNNNSSKTDEEKFVDWKI